MTELLLDLGGCMLQFETIITWLITFVIAAVDGHLLLVLVWILAYSIPSAM